MADVAESPQCELRRRSRGLRSLLREVTTVAEEWETRTEELLTKVDKSRSENDKLRNRIKVLEDVNGKLFDKISVQNEREAYILLHRNQDREKFLQIISGLKERVRVLERDKELALNRTNSTKAVLFLSRSTLVNKINALKKREAVLLHERNEVVNCFSKRIRAQKKRERRKGEVLPLTVQVKQAKRIISRAEDAFCESAKNWVRDRDCIEAMKISCGEGLVDKILGRKERPSEAQAALRDILDESQTMVRQPQTEHNILAASEFKDSEKKKARRKQNNPQRLETSPSPSPQETEVCCKRKRIGTNPPPSSEEMEVPRSRRKPQRYGTSPPPPSKRIKRSRECKRPQRYQ